MKKKKSRDKAHPFSFICVYYIYGDWKRYLLPILKDDIIVELK